MFDELISVSPCSDWESAASLANRAHRGPPLVRRYRYVCRHEFAYGTVSWPLRDVASLSGGFYGTAEAIGAMRTLVDYSALSYGGALRTLFHEDVRNGVGSDMHADLRRTAVNASTLSMACPRCEEQVWSEFGMRAQLWLHQGPFVEACAIDGCTLRPWVPGGTPPAASGAGRIASAAKIAFAKDVVALSRVAGDPCALAAAILHKLQQLGLYVCDRPTNVGPKERNRSTNIPLLSKRLYDYVQAHYRGTAVERIMVFPHACKVLLKFLRAPQFSVPPHFLVALHSFVRDTSVGPAEDWTSAETARHEPWRAQACEPPWPADERASRDPATLLNAGFSHAAVADRCNLTRKQVQRRITKGGIAAQAKRARRRVLRDSARAAWVRICAAMPGVSTTLIQQFENALYLWLRRNDPAWIRTTRYGCLRPLVVALPDQARVLTDADVLVVLPHLEKVLWGVRERRYAKLPRKPHFLALASGIPEAQLEALCRTSPALNQELKRLLQRSTLAWSQAVGSKPVSKSKLPRGARRSRHA